MHDDRIERADQIPVDLSVFQQQSGSSSEASKSGKESKQETGIRAGSNLLPPIIDYDYLIELYGSDADGSEFMNLAAAARNDLFQIVQSRGGCCLVRFQSDSKYASTFKNMWGAMEDFFAQVDTERGATSQDQNTQADGPDLKRQHLTRPDQAPDAGGYDFVQTYWDEETKRVVPRTIQESLGWDHPCTSAVEDSFQALLEVSKLFAIVLSAGGLQRPIWEMESLLNDAILDDVGCCNHRLCQYRPVVEDPKDGGAETLLRSHTDWSLVTCIPVSPTPGLLVFDPYYKKWLAPDTVISSVGALDDDGNDQECNSQYCLMMTGKAMDMLVGVQGGLACIHQVVPMVPNDQNSSSQHQARKNRISAPFFLRPKESISVKINEECNHTPCPSLQESIEKLHQVYCELAE